MDKTRKYIVKRVLLVFAVAFCAILVLVREAVRGALSQVSESVYLFVLCAAIAAAVALTLKGASRLHVESGGSTGDPGSEALMVHTRKSARRLKVYIVIINVFLIYGLWANRTTPSWPLFVGALISLGITAWLINLVVRLRRIEKEQIAAGRRVARVPRQ